MNYLTQGKIEWNGLVLTKMLSQHWTRLMLLMEAERLSLPVAQQAFPGRCHQLRRKINKIAKMTLARFKVSTNSHLMDAFSRPNFYNAAAREWLCLRVEMLSCLTFAFSLIFLISLPTGLIHPGMLVTCSEQYLY